MRGALSNCTVHLDVKCACWLDKPWQTSQEIVIVHTAYLLGLEVERKTLKWRDCSQLGRRA